MRFTLIALGVIAVIGLVALPLASIAADKANGADDFTIEEYDFEWIVAKSGDVKLRVEKTQDTTCITLSDEMRRLNIPPKDAEAVGAALAKVDDYWKKMKGSSEDVQETVEAGKYEMTFRNSTKYGFGVWVREGERFAMSSVSLKRDEAKLFAPHMQKAQKMAAFVNRKIAF